MEDEGEGEKYIDIMSSLNSMLVWRYISLCYIEVFTFLELPICGSWVYRKNTFYLHESFDIYHGFYALNSAFNSLIKSEELDFQLTEQMPLKHAMFAVEKILPNLSKDKLRTIEINHNTIFWYLIKLNSSLSYLSLNTIHLKNLIKLPFASVMSLLQRSSQLKHLKIQIESNKDSS